MDKREVQEVKKIYFACSIAGGRDHSHVYKDIIKYIKAAGAEVVSELFAGKDLQAQSGTNPEWTSREIWQRDTNWVSEAAAVIAEVTQPSLGVGYEIAKAEGLGKPVLALFYSGSGKRLSPMIAGNPSVKVFEYTDVSQTQKAIANLITKLN